MHSNKINLDNTRKRAKDYIEIDRQIDRNPVIKDIQNVLRDLLDVFSAASKFSLLQLVVLSLMDI